MYILTILILLIILLLFIFLRKKNKYYCFRDNKKAEYFIKYGMIGCESHVIILCHGIKCKNLSDELWEKSKINVSTGIAHWFNGPLELLTK